MGVIETVAVKGPIMALSARLGGLSIDFFDGAIEGYP
jgi:hypothetical protein